VALEIDAGQRMAGIVFRRDADDDAGVGVAFVARILAHAVGDHAARFRRGRDHRAAGAHAEAVDRAAVARVMHQLVVGGAEQRVPGEIAEAGAVDQRLRMFDAEADRERLGFDVDARSCSIWKVSRALWPMPARRGRRHAFAAGQFHAAHLATLSISVDVDIDHALEADSPPSDSMSARMFSTMLHQPEGADVRLADVEDFVRRAGLHEFGRAPCGRSASGP
jgi:hypothetical protein